MFLETFALPIKFKFENLLLPAMEETTMFLSIDDLAQFTGRRKRNLQCQWLEQNGVPYTVNARKEINVLRSYVEKLHGLNSDIDPKEPSSRTTPNFDAFKLRNDPK